MKRIAVFLAVILLLVGCTVEESPHTTEFTAGEAIGQYDVVYLSGTDTVTRANSSANTTMPVVAIASTAVASGATGTFITYGYVTDSSWSWTVNGLIYADNTSGQMTQTVPSASGQIVQVVAVATEVDTILFDPQLFVMGLR